MVERIPKLQFHSAVVAHIRRQSK